MKSAPEKINKILLINVAGIGDFVGSVSAMKSIRDHFPEAYIALLTSSRVSHYAKDCPYVNEVFEFPVSHGKGYAFNFKCIYSSLLRLRKIKFDMAVSMYELGSWGGALRMAAMLMFIGAKHTIGRNTLNRGFFLDKKIDDSYGKNKSHFYYFNKLAESLTHSPVKETPFLWINDKDSAFINDILIKWGIQSSDKLIIINPGTDRPSRQWPPQYFSGIANYLTVKYSSKIVITGIKSELNLAKDISSKINSKVFLAAEYISTVGQLVALIKKARLLISTNTAAIHIAGNLGIPLIAISGSSDPKRDMPIGNPGKIALLWKDVGCNPCAFISCPKKSGMECMQAIKPEMVINSIDLFLKDDLKR
jgi:ADP-heptose:LPS heptosyltransferase